VKETIILTSTYYKPHFGGVENSIYFLGKEYLKLGFKVVILCSDAPIDKKGRLAKESYEEGMQVVRFRRYLPFFGIDLFFKPLIDAIIVFRKIKHLNQVNKELNLIISRSGETSLGALLTGIKTIYIVPGILKYQNWLSGFNVKSFIINYLATYPSSVIQNIALKKVKVVLAFSERMKDQIENFSGRADVSILPPGVDTDKYRPVVIRPIHRFSGYDAVFLVVGRLISLKGIDIAIRSFANVQNTNTAFVIIGDGPEKKNLQELAMSLGIENRVFFEGLVSNNIESYYNSADAYFMTSTHETFGQTLLEAMSCGIPILGWKSGGDIHTATAEIVNQGETGFLVNFGVEFLTKAIDDFMGLDRSARINLTKNNRELVLRKYSWGLMAKKILNNV
jgi:1,2-diacylglycerol 3-alpha-glucosyltransferase